jgi:ATP-binding cassette subfamily B protein/subfamily B ATP-binding cassette protein MsbA
LQRLSLHFYEDTQTGQLMSRVVNDSDLFEQLISHAVPDVVVNVLTLVGVSAVLFSLNWRLALLSLVPIPLVVVSLQVYARYVRPAFRERQKELGDLNATLNDNLSGIREIKAFTREEDELHRIGVKIDRYRQSLLRALRLMATFQPFVEFTFARQHRRHLLWRALAFNQTLRWLTWSLSIFEMRHQPVRNLSTAWENIQECWRCGSSGRFAEEEPEILDALRACVSRRAKGAISSAM